MLINRNAFFLIQLWKTVPQKNKDQRQLDVSFVILPEVVDNLDENLYRKKEYARFHMLHILSDKETLAVFLLYIKECHIA